jgi:hypothetical protein
MKISSPFALLMIIAHHAAMEGKYMIVVMLAEGKSILS